MRLKWFALAVLFAGIPSEGLHAKSQVFWCEDIPALREIQDAQFTSTYIFDTNDKGKPIHIKQVGSPLLKEDSSLLACIARWSLPPNTKSATASFAYHWGWTRLYVSAKDLKRTIPYTIPEVVKQPVQE